MRMSAPQKCQTPQQTPPALYRLYLANRHGRPFTPAERRSVLRVLKPSASGLGRGATLLDATGLWAGRTLPTLVVHIAGRECTVRGVAERLRRRFGQQAVGLERGGSFEIIRGGEP
jgi:hypothetical protein